MMKMIGAASSLLSVLVLSGCSGEGNQSDGPKASASSVAEVIEPTPADARRGASCGVDGKVSQVDFGVAAETVLLTAPRKGVAPIKMKVGESDLPAPLELDATVRELCRAGSWSEVRVLTIPKELQPLQGWVPASYLRPVKVTAAGQRLYEIGDFDWPAGNKQDRAAAVRVMNRIMTERPECEALDRQSLISNKVGNRTVFNVPCYDGGDMQSFDFTAADAANGRSFARVEPISKIDAVEACKSAVLSRASHPSTVDFPTFDYDQRDGGDGRTQLLMSFKAKNGFNLELSYDAQCDFTGAMITGVSISEADGG